MVPVQITSSWTSCPPSRDSETSEFNIRLLSKVHNDGLRHSLMHHLDTVVVGVSLKATGTGTDRPGGGILLYLAICNNYLSNDKEFSCKVLTSLLQVAKDNGPFSCLPSDLCSLEEQRAPDPQTGREQASWQDSSWWWRICSQICQPKMGSPDHPPPFVSQCQHLPDPPSFLHQSLSAFGKTPFSNRISFIIICLTPFTEMTKTIQ